VYSGFCFNWAAGRALRGFIRKNLGELIPGEPRGDTPSLRRRETFRAPTRGHVRKDLAVFLAILAFLILSAWSWPLPAHAQTYYYTGRNPATPEANDAASAIACDADAIGAIRYNTGTAVFEGCNGTAWADIRTGATATPAGSTGQVQFNSGGAFGASANFTWNLGTGLLEASSYDTNASTGTYKLGGATILTYPFAGADTTSWAVGPNALANVSANTLHNTAVGVTAMQGTAVTPLTGSDNTALGFAALLNIQGAATQNTAVGYKALLSQTSAFPNTAVGYNAGEFISTGFSNTAIGTSAMTGVSATRLTGQNNTAVGDTALNTIQGAASDNTAVGFQALFYNTTGSNNVALGHEAMNGISATRLTGGANTALGTQALFVIQGAAQNNTALGRSAGLAVTTGTDNTLLGWSAGSLVTGNSNIIVGEAGNITTGGSNILIGNGLTFTSATRYSQLDIGDTIFGDLSGKKVGINTGAATPGTALDVNGGVTVEPTTVTLTANNTVLATANRSYFQVTSDNTTATNRIFCFGAGTLGQVLVIEWTSSTNRGEIVKGGNCSAAAGAVTASLSGLTWAPKATETILQLMYNGTHWIQIAGSANY
jgi:hypothetical protein